VQLDLYGWCIVGGDPGEEEKTKVRRLDEIIPGSTIGLLKESPRCSQGATQGRNSVVCRKFLNRPVPPIHIEKFNPVAPFFTRGVIPREGTPNENVNIVPRRNDGGD
jgi:hypothetical protein